MKTELIAPCGMNCRICIAYFGYTMSGAKRKKKCMGCYPTGKSCSHLKKYCEKLTRKKIGYCFECNDFPCKKLQRLDASYRQRFNMSMIDNLRNITQHGMKQFLQSQKLKYECPNCGGVVCVHDGKCYECTLELS